jgi:hypothetical protein
VHIGKAGGAVAALALVSAFVFGGMEVAHADGGAPASGPIAPPSVGYVMGYATGSATATPTVDGATVHTTLSRPFGASSPLACVAVGTSSAQRCDFGELRPGDWVVTSWQEVGGVRSPARHGLFHVPKAPALSAIASDTTVNFSGTSEPFSLVSVLDEHSATVCSTKVTFRWSCSAPMTPGEHSFRAFALAWGAISDTPSFDVRLLTILQGKSALTAPVQATVVLPDPDPTPEPTPTESPTPTPTPSPSPTATPTPEPTQSPTPAPSASPSPSASPTPTRSPAPSLRWALIVTGMNAALHPGDIVTLGGTGLPEGSVVSLAIHSTPISLGSAIVGANGSFSKTVAIPANIEPGSHHFVATLTAPGSSPSVAETPVTIAAPEELKTLALPVPDSSAGQAPAVGGNSHKGTHKSPPAGVEPRDTPEAPSALSSALPTLATLAGNPIAIPLAAGFALAIMLLVAIPTEILNNSIASNLGRFGPLIARAERAAERAAERLNRIARTPAAAAAILILITSIIFGFTDPHYGFDLVSVRMTLALALAMFIVYYLSSRLSGWIVKSRWHVDSSISLHPLAIIFAIVGVILARLLGFSPGFLIGFALGLQLSGSSTAENRARAVIVRTSIVVGLALLSWAGYSLFELWNEGGPETFLGGITQETLVAITAEGLTGAVVSLLPLGFMEGRELWEHSRAKWVGLFLVTGTVFSLLVLPTALAGEEIGSDITVWLLVLCGFTVVALGTWLFLRLTDRPQSGESREEANEAEDERIQI